MLVNFRTSSKYPDLRIGKYAKKVFYKNLWNDELENYRGLVLDSEDNIVSYPFTKIYNYGIEALAPQFDDNEFVSCYRKVNGFMVAVTWYNDDLLVTTTGSLEGKYVDYAYEMLDRKTLERVCREWKDYTLMFECVHTSDPHIIVEEPGMYFLGCRHKSLGSSIIVPYIQGLNNPSCEYITFKEVKQLAREAKHEGYVIYAEDVRATKIKSPHYLIKKFLARTTNLLSERAEQLCDEEYYGLITAARASEKFASMKEQERLRWIENFLGNMY